MMAKPSAKTPHLAEKVVLVTVGSTLFDRLIEVMTTEEMLTLLKTLGYTTLVMQYGKGNVIPDSSYLPDFAKLSSIIQMESYRFKPTLLDDMNRADLIISHAGAGSIMESLKMRKKLIVVVNEILMDNHQQDLAEEMENMGFSYSATCSTLLRVLRKADFGTRKPLPEESTGVVAQVIAQELAFVHTR